jgi:hypothetical protein
MHITMHVFGADVGVAYDIGCSFLKTVQKSSIAALAKELRLRFVVPTFHGYAHNMACQLDFHPLWVQGLWY